MGSPLLYTYDQLGRQLSRTINGSSKTVIYDALGRVGNILNALGNFTATYNGSTGDLDELLLPERDEAAPRLRRQHG